MRSRARTPPAPLVALAAGAVVGLLAVPAHAGPRIVKESLQYLGGTRTYYLYAPESPPAEGAPLLLVFHGSRRNGLSLVERWTKLADQHRFIVAGLDSHDSQVWGIPADGPEVVKALVEALQGRYRIDDRRLYLFGHSAGAAFVLKLGLIQSQYFAAGAVHAGAFRQSGEFEAIDFARRKIPLKVIVGDRDEFFPLTSVNATVEALKTREFPVELEVVKRHDHWYYDRAQVFNQSAWSFLAAHELEAAPAWTEYRFE